MASVLKSVDFERSCAAIKSILATDAFPSSDQSYLQHFRLLLTITGAAGSYDHAHAFLQALDIPLSFRVWCTSDIDHAHILVAVCLC
jgi:hypothetical protein